MSRPFPIERIARMRHPRIGPRRLIAPDLGLRPIGASLYSKDKSHIALDTIPDDHDTDAQ